MARTLRTTIILWVTSFIAISLFHGYQFYVWMNELPSFYASFSDIFIVGGILSFVSLASTFLLFLWLVYLIRKPQYTISTLIWINIILFVSSLIAFMLVEYVTSNGWEALSYVGSYAGVFTVIINVHFQNTKRRRANQSNLEHTDILDQLG